MVAAVALTGVFKKMKVAAAQRVVVSLRAQQCSLGFITVNLATYNELETSIDDYR